MEDRGKCAVCSIENKSTEPRVYCPRCEAPHCESCWEYNDRRCAIYGCARTLMIPPVVHPPGFESPIFRPVSRRARARSMDELAIMPIFTLIIACVMMLGIISFWKVDNDDFFYEKPYNSEGSGRFWRNGLNDFEFRSVKIRFNDGSTGTISGNIRYKVPNSHSSLTPYH
jgi:hypothetical protein